MIIQKGHDGSPALLNLLTAKEYSTRFGYTIMSNSQTISAYRMGKVMGT
jgi:hypothetical protein